MKKGFGLLDILIIIGLVSLGVLAYLKYFDRLSRITEIVELSSSSAVNGDGAKIATGTNVIEVAKNIIDQANVKNQENSQAIKEAGSEGTAAAATTTAATKPATTTPEVYEGEDDDDVRTPRDPFVPVQPKPTTTEPAPQPADGPASPGFYENKTYFYKISFPTSWPIKVRNEGNVSVGTVPPKNGQGAVTIEISTEDPAAEISQAKKEAAAYPGISISESQATIDGEAASKMTISNSYTKSKDIYYFIERNGNTYALKYSEVSAAFTAQAEEAIANFHFTK